MAGKRKSNANHPKKRRTTKEPFSFKKLTEKQQKLIKIGFIALLVLIIALITLNAYDLLPHFDGSLHIIGGELKGAKENDLILNTETRDDPKYFNLGSVEIPEGYYNDEAFHTVISTSTAKDYSQKYCYRPTDSENPLSMVVVQGSPNSWQNLLANIAKTYSDPEVYVMSDEINKVSTEKGNAYHGYYATGIEKTQDVNNNGYVTREYYNTVAVSYIETKHDDKCIMVYSSFKSDTEEQIPTAEYIEALMDQMVDTVTVNK